MGIKRRDTLKTLLIGGIAFTALPGCDDDSSTAEVSKAVKDSGSYGRTEKEKLRDHNLAAQPDFFTEAELTTLAILIDLILPSDDISGSASEAGVMDFIQFIVKDMKYHQMPMRSGLAWLDRESDNRYEMKFVELSTQQQKDILDDIAYPGKTKLEHLPGEKFFTRIRNLTMTGFYTSRVGVEDLGYQGNRPNFWNGVPDDVLAKHGLSYKDKYKDLYITEEKRTLMAKWDEEGNLI